MDQICAFAAVRRSCASTASGWTSSRSLRKASSYLLVVDLRRGKDTRRILADLNRCFPDARGRLAEGVREALGPRNAGIVARARAALIEADARTLGALMIGRQAIFDRLVLPPARSCGRRAPRGARASRGAGPRVGR